MEVRRDEKVSKNGSDKNRIATFVTLEVTKKF